MAAEGDDGMEVERSNPIMNHRFSTLRFMRTVKQFNPIQRGYIINRNMEYLLKLPHHLMVPSSLLHWLVYYTVPRSGGKFKKKNKIMWFTKNIADKVFGFEEDSFRYPLGSNDPAVVSEVESILRQYVKGKDVPLNHLESILLGTNDEVKFLRSFVWYFLSTVLCPGTKNNANPKYLYGLTDRNMPDIQYWDYGTLCIDNLFEEIDEWKLRSMRPDGEFNTSGWIGGCIPLLAVGYMDFIDFNGNDGGIDYGIPRMQHIRNQDFIFLENADRNRKSRRQYGILPFRTFSLTPYGDPNNVGEDPPYGIPPEYYAPYEIDDNENVLDEDVAFNEDPHDNAELPPNEDGVLCDNDVEIQDVLEEEIEHIYDEESEIQDMFLQMVTASVVDKPQFGENDGGDGEIQFNDNEDTNPEFDIGIQRNDIELPLAIEGPVVDGDAANIDNDVILSDPDYFPYSSPQDFSGGRPSLNEENTSGSVDAHISHSIPFGGENNMHTTHGVAEGFVLPNVPTDSVAPTTVIGMAASKALGEPSISPNTLDKKNRKKRAAKTSSPDTFIPKLRTNADVDAFCAKFLRAKYFKADNSPTFVGIGGYSVTYDSFHKSFKARGDMVDDTMCLCALMFNEEHKRTSATNAQLMKYMFSPYATTKLTMDPSIFDKSFVVAEFRRISHGVDITKIDIMHFPSIVSKRWTLISVNQLYCTTIFFDPTGMIRQQDQDVLIQNLLCNLKTVCKELELCCKDYQKFNTCRALSYPTHALMHDCGFYVMLYAENFNGKVMGQFDKSYIPKYRMIKAFTMFYSTSNEVDVEHFERMKKR